MDKQNLFSWSHNLCSGALGLVKIFRNISYGGESAKLPRLPSRGWWWRSHCWRTVSPPHPSSLGQIRLLTSRRENLNRTKVIRIKIPSINLLLTQCAHTHDAGVVCSVWPGLGNWRPMSRLRPDVTSGPLSSSPSLVTTLSHSHWTPGWKFVVLTRREERGGEINPNLIIDWMMQDIID